jgi:hypothetical protein
MLDVSICGGPRIWRRGLPHLDKSGFLVERLPLAAYPDAELGD